MRLRGRLTCIWYSEFKTHTLPKKFAILVEKFIIDFLTVKSIWNFLQLNRNLGIWVVHTPCYLEIFTRFQSYRGGTNLEIIYITCLVQIKDQNMEKLIFGNATSFEGLLYYRTICKITQNSWLWTTEQPVKCKLGQVSSRNCKTKVQILRKSGLQ